MKEKTQSSTWRETKGIFTNPVELSKTLKTPIKQTVFYEIL